MSVCSNAVERPRSIRPHMAASFQHRLVLTGMVGLALLSATHHLRDIGVSPGPLGTYVLGVLPNFAAALAMPLVLSGLAPRIAEAAEQALARRSFAGMLAFTTTGLAA